MDANDTTLFLIFQLSSCLSWIGISASCCSSRLSYGEFREWKYDARRARRSTWITDPAGRKRDTRRGRSLSWSNRTARILYHERVKDGPRAFSTLSLLDCRFYWLWPSSLSFFSFKIHTTAHCVFRIDYSTLLYVSPSWILLEQIYEIISLILELIL